MKQINYTKEQELVLEILKPLEDIAHGDPYNSVATQLQQVIKDIRAKYKLQEKYLTLREYLKKYSCGAYHHFIFKISSINIDVIGIDEFERYYNGKLLDKYFVIRDDYSSNGGDCCTFDGKHILMIEEIEK